MRWFLVGIIVFLIGTTLQAQQVDTLGSPSELKQLSLEELMDVKVTSVSGHAEKLSEAASAIQVITQEEIHRSGALSLPEVLRLATNLEVAQVDSRNWSISARGFSSTTANKLLVLIDGRTVYTPLYSGVFWDAQDIPLQDVDHIEVISGPGATLWGSNAVNGVINVITKPAADTRGLAITGGAGNVLQGFGSLRYGGSTGKVHYRLRAEGFGREASVLPTGAESTDNWKMGHGGGRIDWDASQRDQVSLLADVFDGAIRQTAPSDIGLSGGNIIGSWSRTLSDRSNLRLQAYYDRSHRDIPGAFGEDLGTWDLNFQHRFPLGRTHDVTWGAGFHPVHDHVSNSAAIAFLPATVWRKWITGFVQDEIRVVRDILRLGLGAKIEHNDYTGVEVQPGARLGLKLREGHTLWGAVSRAVRTPSRIDRDFFSPSTPPYLLAGGPNFQSEDLIAYELGYRAQIRTLGFSVSTFYNQYDHIRSIEQVNPPAVFPLVIGNGQEGHTYGAELDARYQVTPDWQLHAGWTELRVSIHAKPGSTDVTQGSSEAHDPEHQLFAGTSVTVARAVSLDGRFRYISRIVNQNVPGYGEVGLRLAWRPVKSLELAVSGENLLHQHHLEFGSGTTRREIGRGAFAQVTWQF